MSVTTLWRGASAGDIEALITTPLEQDLRAIDAVKRITSTSSEANSRITLEFAEDADIELAVARVKAQVDAASGLPEGSERPRVAQLQNYEEIASLLVAGPADIDDLRPLVRRFERELLARGIASIQITGLPKEEIAIEIPSHQLRRLGLSLDAIGRRVAAWSKDAPVGVVGQAEVSRQLRFRERRQTALAFESVPVAASGGRLLSLGSIAHIERKAATGQPTITHNGGPAVRMSLRRAAGGDSLEAATIFSDWLRETRPTLPPGVALLPYNQSWELLRERIDLLLKNGLGGLLLVVLILFLFMNGRVAWWTAVGIPVSFMGAMAALYLVGGSLNMISLFGMIMALGIIVDDAIVVGEEAMSQYERGAAPSAASEKAARRMLGLVCASSLTTIAAFMPLLLVGGIIGTIMRAIPTVVICIIVASLVECFLILPGHLTHSFRSLGEYRPKRARRALDAAFAQFREAWFRPLLTLAVRHRWSTLAAAAAALILTFGWMQAGRIGFHFFPLGEGNQVYAQVGFAAGTPPDTVTDYLAQAAAAMGEIEAESGEPFIAMILLHHHGEHTGRVRVELVDSDQRNTRNRDLIAAWQSKLPPRPGLESLAILEPQAGPPGRDIDLEISGPDLARVKKAALQLQAALAAIPGVNGIGDDSPYGREQWLLRLTPTAESLGLSVDEVSRQLRAAYTGYEALELSDGYRDITVRVSLPPAERDTLGGLAQVPIVLPGGNAAPLGNLVDLSAERGFESILHVDGKLSITVTASVDHTIATAGRIRAALEADILPQLADRYGVEFSFGGRAAEQTETLGDMQTGLLLALALIYLVLAWVFGSYGLPVVVMAVIPFGLVGAVWGHVLMGQEVTVLSLFGFFALSGIVVNDSIILVVFYKRLRGRGWAAREAVIEAACRRLRAVLLTSLTTIAGLSPLLFETSLQAQFLIPMATTIAFGLAFATLLVLIVIPSLLLVYENADAGIRTAWRGRRG